MGVRHGVSFSCKKNIRLGGGYSMVRRWWICLVRRARKWQDYEERYITRNFIIGHFSFNILFRECYLISMDDLNLIIVQQDATAFILLYFCRQLYMFRVLTSIISSNSTARADGSRPSWPVPEAVITVVRAPDDGCQHPKHVELPTEI